MSAMPDAHKSQRSAGRRLIVAMPYLWLLAFFLVPFLIVLKISLSQTAIAQPPYTPVLDLAAGLAGLREFFAGLSFDNYASLAADPIYLASYLKSLQVAAVCTAELVLIGRLAMEEPRVPGVPPPRR